MTSERDTITSTAMAIAEQLGETDDIPRHQIGRIVRTIGADRTQAFVTEALEIEANGGMLLPDGSRRRTVGGIFFYLVRGGVTPKERWRIWPQRTTPHQSTGASSAPATPALPAFRWEDAGDIIEIVLEQSEEARTVKITLIGRPGQVVERQGVMVLSMRPAKPPALPKGMPDLPAQPTNYLVFVATKQWRKVADTITNPEDVLIIEGYPTHHPQFAGITVYATQVTTKLQQQAKRQQQEMARSTSS